MSFVNDEIIRTEKLDNKEVVLSIDSSNYDDFSDYCPFIDELLSMNSIVAASFKYNILVV